MSRERDHWNSGKDILLGVVVGGIAAGASRLFRTAKEQNNYKNEKKSGSQWRDSAYKDEKK